MCIHYTDLNRHCPKDPFPLPRIDHAVDSTAGCILLCFLDYYSGYHQIALNPADQDRTVFITPYGIYCYNTMTFGLKNIAVELGEFDIEFCPHHVIKSQILAVFVAEWTKIQEPPSLERPEHWTMYFDGVLNLEGLGAGVLFVSPKGEQLKYVLQIHYKATNNGVEYEALIHGLRIAASLGIKRILTYDDSKVVIENVN
ncbi:uncharacterized protein [Setaria viridis]|uniref:uncharacterized protein n=1 Tax=Setaria viridis TaxID=4556 RepID=UPI001493C98C|nr:uncharacterized protein LOC117853415 [Setaria viridis]